ncbi:unnamed protein product [Rotaria sp. Silwood2]|nr:unnamed protein product [Rotaria sp. Silwood2]
MSALSMIITTFFPAFLLFTLFVFYPIDANENVVSMPNENCTVKYGRRLLKEGTEISINRKLYKVEDCQLQRAYQTCGPHLWHIINIVCDAIDQHKRKNQLSSRIRRFAQEKLLSDACCLSSCTVAEMTRYCPT